MRDNTAEGIKKVCVNPKRLGVAALSFVVIVVTLVLVAELRDGNVERRSIGSYYYDREILEQHLDSNPGVHLYLPVELPSSYELHNVLSIKRDDGAGTATERLLRFANFNSDNYVVTYVCVRYLDSPASADPRCRPNGYDEMVLREVGELVIYISFKGAPDVGHREAWRTVEFVNDLDAIDWLASS